MLLTFNSTLNCNEKNFKVEETATILVNVYFITTKFLYFNKQLLWPITFDLG